MTNYTIPSIAQQNYPYIHFECVANTHLFAAWINSAYTDSFMTVYNLNALR